MGSGFRNRSHWVYLVCLLSTSVLAQPRLFFVPKGGNPSAYPSGRTVIPAAAGEQVCLEIYVTAEPQTVYGVEPWVEGTGTGGDTGSLDVDCLTAAIDEDHPRFPAPAINAVAAQFCPTKVGYLIVAEFPSTSLNIPADGAYLGEVCYDLSSDASGTFGIDFVVGQPTEGHVTLVVDPSFQYIDPVLNGADIAVGATGACCLFGTCADMSLAGCAAAGGFWDGADSCAGASCVIGACCLQDDSCTDTRDIECSAMGGQFAGDGTDCATTYCGPAECTFDTDCDDGDECTLDRCVEGACVNCAKRNADVNQDCAVNVFDLFCVLSSFGGSDACGPSCP